MCVIQYDEQCSGRIFISSKHTNAGSRISDVFDDSTVVYSSLFISRSFLASKNLHLIALEVTLFHRTSLY